MSDRVLVIGADADSPELALVEGVGEARALVWPGMGARHRSLHRVRLGAGARTRALRHPGEAVWYVAEGEGFVEAADGERQDLVTGSMVHIGPEDGYRLVASGGGMLVAGGPCPPDPALYTELKEG